MLQRKSHWRSLQATPPFTKPTSPARAILHERYASLDCQVVHKGPLTEVTSPQWRRQACSDDGTRLCREHEKQVQDTEP